MGRAGIDVGIAIPLIAAPEGRFPVPRWQEIRERALLAERIGFDVVVVEDSMSWPGEDITGGAWESVSLLGGLAETTSTIRIGHSVINAPYRPPGLIANIALTLDEMSGGRYVFGLGAGNTPDEDYASFGIDADPRFSRFAEGLEIISRLLKDGRAEFDGRFHRADDAKLVLRGPREQGPPIVVAAGGPRMKRLAAQLADEWNWWAPPGDLSDVPSHLDEVARACEGVGRDPASLRHSLDAYLPLAEGDNSEAATVDRIGWLAEQGIDEVRLYLQKQETHTAWIEATEALAGVVAQVHGAS